MNWLSIYQLKEGCRTKTIICKIHKQYSSTFQSYQIIYKHLLIRETINDDNSKFGKQKIIIITLWKVTSQQQSYGKKQITANRLVACITSTIIMTSWHCSVLTHNFGDDGKTCGEYCSQDCIAAFKFYKTLWYQFNETVMTKKYTGPQ